MPGNARFKEVDETIIKKLMALDLDPVQTERGIETNHDGLLLVRGESQALALGKLVTGSVEINAGIDHSSLGRHTISDLVTLSGTSKDTVLEECVAAYFDVAFPSIRALFDPGSFQGVKRTMASVNYQGVAVNWNVYSGALQVRNDPTGEVSGFLKSHTPLSLIIDSLGPVLAETRLHWCKLHGEQMPTGRTFGCAIDGKVSPGAKQEMQRKFAPDLPRTARWSFREFLIFAPFGVPNQDDIDDVKRVADAHKEKTQSAPPRTSWRPFSSNRT